MTESMIHIILRSLQGTATTGDEAALERWRAAAPSNEKRFREVEWLVRTVGEVHASLPVDAPPPARAVIRRSIQGEVADQPAPQDVRTRPAARARNLARWPLAAAAGVAGLLLGIGLMSLRTGGAGAPPAFGVEEFSTGAAEKVTVRLADGSLVRLAPESRLRLVGNTGREVWLEGQAFFGIAEQQARPFVIRTRVADAVVLGTRFDLRVDKDDVRVVVVDGKVALSAGGEKVDVGAGQMSIAADEGRPAVVDVDNVYPFIDWLGRSLVFQGTPLRRVAAELGRVYGLEVRILDSVLAERTVTAAFTDESFEQVFSVICDVVGASCAIRETGATMELPARWPGQS